ncbi:YkgJ family cysteine cluster protein [Rubricoccus marinus]|uniref:Zinc/iron-chelating domain-containing protein n=1 Tax=Rubricoccus marinus TaxID=716817 RepID=A0A259TVD4_9BACT|nr:YkgJ family cysteine cluster protein [Rubricoccus marinus]OZC01703.1 hypothetical protein BSZ36_01115 [Rubricoccus marinus]
MTLLPVARTRDTAFSYACNGCGQCCQGKTIAVSPYEAARIAEVLGLSTTDVYSRYLDPETRSIKTEGGACAFFGASGCSVHAGRPIACRLYPLAWFGVGTPREAFGELSPHPQTHGEYGADGTVADYLRDQGTAPYESAIERYAQVLWRLQQALDDEGGTHPGDPPHMTDVDAAVRADCDARGVPVPDDVEARVDLHLAILHRWLDAAAAPASGDA